MTLVIPPVPKSKALKGKSVAVHFFVRDNGKVDSTQISGVDDMKFLATLRETALLYQFFPSYRLGCPVAGRAKFTFTF